MAYVYAHIEKGGFRVFYIGVGKKPNYKRVLETKGRSGYWHNIVRGHGFDVEILYDGLTWPEACEKERLLIRFYGRRDLGTGCLVNMTDGGEGFVNQYISLETRMKMSAAHKGKPRPIDAIIKAATSNRGKKRSEDIKRRMSEAARNRRKSIHTKSFKGFVYAYRDGACVGRFESIVQCAKFINGAASNINSCINGKRRKHKGYTFFRTNK